MTTLRSFQAEIETFAHEKQRQAIKDAREAHAAAEASKRKTKVDKVEIKEAPLTTESQERAEEEDVEEDVRIEVSSWACWIMWLMAGATCEW